VLDTIERDGLLANATAMGHYFAEAVAALRHPAISGTRGRGLLRAVTFERPIAAVVATQARDAGFIINPVAPDAIRLAPPLIIGRPEVDAFVSALGPIADRAIEEMS